MLHVQHLFFLLQNFFVYSYVEIWPPLWLSSIRVKCFEKYCIYIICFHIIYSFSIASRKKMLDFFPKTFKMTLNYILLWKNVTLYMIKIKWLSPILIEMRSVVMMKGAKMLKFKDRRKDSQTDRRTQKWNLHFSFQLNILLNILINVTKKNIGNI